MLSAAELMLVLRLRDETRGFSPFIDPEIILDALHSEAAAGVSPGGRRPYLQLREELKELQVLLTRNAASQVHLALRRGRCALLGTTCATLGALSALPLIASFIVPPERRKSTTDTGRSAPARRGPCSSECALAHFQDAWVLAPRHRASAQRVGANAGSR